MPKKHTHGFLKPPSAQRYQKTQARPALLFLLYRRRCRAGAGRGAVLAVSNGAGRFRGLTFTTMAALSAQQERHGHPGRRRSLSVPTSAQPHPDCPTGPRGRQTGLGRRSARFRLFASCILTTRTSDSRQRPSEPSAAGSVVRPGGEERSLLGAEPREAGSHWRAEPGDDRSPRPGRGARRKEKRTRFPQLRWVLTRGLGKD